MELNKRLLSSLLSGVVAISMLVQPVTIWASDDNEIAGEVQGTEQLPFFDLESDNDELLSIYIDRAFLGEDKGISAFSDVAFNNMGLASQYVYTQLKNFAKSVADGERTSTVVAVNPDEDYLLWTWEDLGYTSKEDALSKNTGQNKGEQDTFFYRAIVSEVLDGLQADCPYEFYWYDKTKGLRYSWGFTTYTDRGLACYGLQFSFAPSKVYAGEQEYTVNTLPDKINTAKNNAIGIVDRNKDLKDYEKIIAYKDAVCSLTDYNEEAITTEYFNLNGYGDPWQLIYVFDNDPATKVVCEGYAKAFQYLCDMSTFAYGSYSYIVSGEMDGVAHMWNVVHLDDDTNYIVDVTNSDTGSIGQAGGLFISPAISGNVSSGYTYSAGGSNILYTYNNETKSIYTMEELSVAGSAYVPESSTPYTKGDWKYTIQDHLVILNRYLGHSSTVTIPKKLDGREVRNLGDDTFKDVSELSKLIVLPNIIGIGGEHALEGNASDLKVYGWRGTSAALLASSHNVEFVPFTISMAETQKTVEKGDKFTINVTLPEEDPDEVIGWSHGDMRVARVDHTGVIEAMGNGTTVIKARVQNEVVQCEVTVRTSVKNIALNKSAVDLECHETTQLSANVLPEDASDKAISWTSSNPEVASVDDNGLVTAHKKGSSIITVTSNDKPQVSASCNVNVVNTKITCDNIADLESEHNYSDNEDCIWTYDVGRADAVLVTFDSRSKLATKDEITFYNKAGQKVAIYRGSELAGRTIELNADILIMELTSDASGNEWGFKVTNVVPHIHNYTFDSFVWSKDFSVCSAKTKCPSFEKHTRTVLLKVTETVIEGNCKDQGVIRRSVNYKGNTDYRDIQTGTDSSKHVGGTTTVITEATEKSNGSVVEKCNGCGATINKTTIYAPKTLSLSKTEYVYSNKNQKPQVKVLDSKGKKIDSKYYTVTWPKDVKTVGKKTVKIVFKGKYQGSKTLSYTIKPAATTISSIKYKNKKILVPWKKVSSQCDGYEVMFGTDSKFKGAKATVISKNSTVSKVFSKIGKNKKYYVKIRTFKKVGKQKYYSDWSKVKTYKLK